MSIKQLSQNVRRGYMLPSSNSVYDGLKCCMNRENKKKGLPIITIKQPLILLVLGVGIEPTRR